MGRKYPASAHWETPSETRRIVSVFIDAITTILAGLAAGLVVGIGRVNGVPQIRIDSLTVWGTAVCAGITLSFFNHVVVALITHRSLGKAIAGLRIVRETDAGPPKLLQLVGRWLFGFLWMIAYAPIHLAADSNVTQQDAAGLRIVRRAKT
ncbi:RDD family protein [Streptomyces sp. NPDC056296]|uniref:RDD family protein n=1 Tax=Streptomyces sp. NPDC056296 TaxID=3345775 RepID=UPI0035DEA67A